MSMTFLPCKGETTPIRIIISTEHKTNGNQHITVSCGVLVTQSWSYRGVPSNRPDKHKLTKELCKGFTPVINVKGKRSID